MSGPFRAATSEDLDAIMALESKTFASDAWSRESMAAELESPHTVYVVALDGTGAVIGYAGLLAPSGAHDADIQTIAVAEHARRRGLGRSLMTQLMDAARGRGASTVFLEVRADNASAQHLYRSLGFEEIGVRARYYQPDDVDAIVMRAPLTARAREATA